MALYPQGWPIDEHDGHEPVKLIGASGFPAFSVRACGLQPIGVRLAALGTSRILKKLSTTALSALDGVEFTKPGMRIELATKAGKDIILPSSEALDWDEVTNCEIIFDRLSVCPPFIDFELTMPADAKMHYQPALTQKEIDEGCGRPEHIVGSFAVYGKYGAKLGHIPRPFLRDAKGATQWCSLELTTIGPPLWTLRVWLPTAWLEARTRSEWPVTKPDLTFGHTGTPMSSGNATANYLYACGSTTNGYSAPATGTITGMSWCGHKDPSVQITLGIYADDTGPTTRLCDTAGGDTPTAKAWIDPDLAVDNPGGGYPMTAAEKLWLVWNLGSDATFYVDVMAGYKTYYNSEAYSHGSLPADPGAWSEFQNWRLGIRATYTDVGGFRVYDNSGIGPIDYDTPEADLGSGATAWTSDTLSYPATHRYGLRAYNEYGEEKNVDQAKTIILDSAGRDASSVPNRPANLRAEAIAGGKIRITWSYSTTGERATCTKFNIYDDDGTGTVDYSVTVDTETKTAGVETVYSWDTAVLTDGTTHKHVVRAATATVEEQNTNAVSATADTTLPTQPASLTVTLVK